MTDAIASVAADRTPAASVRTLGVAMLGHAFMGRAHASAYRTLAGMASPLQPRLVAVAGRDEAAAAEAAARLGFARHAGDWRALLADDAVELFDNCGPNHLHAEATIAAARAGRHVVCEKPLGRDADEAYAMWQAARDAGVVHMCGFNYRFVPAVRLARELIEAGEIGEVLHFRGRYLQDWLADAGHAWSWRLDTALAGSGALGDLGSHVVDLARYLVGEIEAVTASTRTFTRERPGGTVDVDDAAAAVLDFEGGALGTLEVSRCSLGRKNALSWEVNGTRGSIAFDLERLNELHVESPGGIDGGRARGFRRVLVTERDHPFLEHWWPAGHVLGWEHSFVHELLHLLAAIRDRGTVEPHGASFRDGYRAAEVCDAIARAAAHGGRERVRFRA